MKRIHRLDFLRDQPRPWAGWLLAGVGAITALACLLPLRTLQADIEGRQQVLANHQRAVTAAATPTALSPTERLRQNQARRLLVQLDAPWNELFDLLEAHAQPQIGLLRIEPDAASGQIRLMALAKNLTAMTDWLRALEQDPQLQDVQLLQHQIEEQVPGRPVRFNLVAHWRLRDGGAAPTARAAQAGLSAPQGAPQ